VETTSTRPNDARQFPSLAATPRLVAIAVLSRKN
jgi:hypothetical protein